MHAKHFGCTSLSSFPAAYWAICVSAAAYTTGWDSRKGSRIVKRRLREARYEIRRTILKLGRGEYISDGDDATHDGVNAAEVEVAARSESWDGEGTVREHEAGIEGAEIALLHTADMGHCMF